MNDNYQNELITNYIIAHNKGLNPKLQPEMCSQLLAVCTEKSVTSFNIFNKPESFLEVCFELNIDLAQIRQQSSKGNSFENIEKAVARAIYKKYDNAKELSRIVQAAIEENTKKFDL